MEDQVQEDVSRETTSEEQPVNSMGERPEWLPEKFKSAEDFANSYHNPVSYTHLTLPTMWYV